MRVDTLEKLQAAFSEWRSQKRFVREQVPAGLMERARRAVPVFGLGEVARAVKIDRARITDGPPGQVKSKDTRRRRDHRAADAAKPRRAARAAATRTKSADIRIPSYSRLEFPGLETVTRPLAEIETPAGVKLRVYTLTAETVGLLSALSGSGVAL